MSAVAETHGHDDHDVHHHKETFVTKYIFSQDHKMIAKQYLITGVLIMGIIGILMSLMIRMQIAWPEQPNVIFETLLGNGLREVSWMPIFI
jgi:cytochrome c oxidase subunit 1